jgi:hypothetical protein
VDKRRAKLDIWRIRLVLERESVFDDADFLPLVLLGREGRLDDLPMIVSYLRFTLHLMRACDSVCKLEGSLLDSN